MENRPDVMEMVAKGMQRSSAMFSKLQSAAAAAESEDPAKVALHAAEVATATATHMAAETEEELALGVVGVEQQQDASRVVAEQQDALGVEQQQDWLDGVVPTGPTPKPGKKMVEVW